MQRRVQLADLLDRLGQAASISATPSQSPLVQTHGERAPPWSKSALRKNGIRPATIAVIPPIMGGFNHPRSLSAMYVTVHQDRLPAVLALYNNGAVSASAG